MKRHYCLIAASVIVFTLSVGLAFAACDGAGQVVIPGLMKVATVLGVLGVLGTGIGVILIDDHKRHLKALERQARLEAQWDRYFADFVRNTDHVR